MRNGEDEISQKECPGLVATKGQYAMSTLRDVAFRVRVVNTYD